VLAIGNIRMVLAFDFRLAVSSWFFTKSLARKFIAVRGFVVVALVAPARHCSDSKNRFDFFRQVAT
jgi:hypothetical protein